MHARINARIKEENKTRADDKKIPACLIEPETVSVASLSSKNFLDFYKDKNGKIWGITGTTGSKEERQEHADKFGFKLNSIPPHKTNQRITHDPILIDSNEQHKQEIFNQIWHRIRTKQKMPSLIICKNPIDAEKLHKFLKDKLSEEKYKKQYPLCLQLLSAATKEQEFFGSDPDIKLGPDNDLKDYVEQAGFGGTITISTPMLGRGTDFKPVEEIFEEVAKERKTRPHPHGLFVAQTYLDILRNERQGEGRAARGGANGEAMTILSKEDLARDLRNVGETSKLSKIKKRELAKYIAIIRAKRNLSATEQRKQAEVLGDIRNIYFKKILFLLDNINDYYQDERGKDPFVSKFTDVSLYRISLLKQWEEFLLDLDLKSAKLLSLDSAEKITIEQFSDALLAHANGNWIIKFNEEIVDLEDNNNNINFKPFTDKYSESQALSGPERITTVNQVITHAYTSHPPPPPKDTTRKLSANINKDKLAYNVFPDPKLINPAIEYELNALYQKTRKLKKINKSFIEFSISDKFFVLHTTLYQAYSDALVRNPNSPKVDQYRALIGKLEKEAKWYVEKTNDPIEKNVMSEPRDLHFQYLIQNNRTSQLLEFKRKLKHPTNNVILLTLNKANADINQFRPGFSKNKTHNHLSDNLSKMIPRLLFARHPEDVESLMKLIVEQRKIAYLGENDFKPLSTDSKYHLLLDNILAGFIASGDKNILQPIYEAELQDINVLIKCIQTKYPKNLNLQNKCKKLLTDLTTKTDIDVQRQLNSLANDLPDKALKSNLLTKINHLNEINLRENLYKVKLKEPAINEIILPEKIVEPSLYKKLFTPLQKRVVNPARTIIKAEKLDLSMPRSRSPSTSSSASSTAALPPLPTLPNPVEPPVSRATPPPVTVENFMSDNSTTVMVQLQTNSSTQSSRIVMAENVDISSDPFKKAAKKAINKVLKTATETTIFNISNKLPEPTKNELTDYLVTALALKLDKPVDEVRCQINPINPPAMSSPTL